MCLVSNIAKIAKGDFSHASIENMQYLSKNSHPKVQEEQQRGVEFPGHRKVKAERDRHLAMISENHTDNCLPCQYLDKIVSAITL